MNTAKSSAESETESIKAVGANLDGLIGAQIMVDIAVAQGV